MSTVSAVSNDLAHGRSVRWVPNLNWAVQASVRWSFCSFVRFVKENKSGTLRGLNGWRSRHTKLESALDDQRTIGGRVTFVACVRIIAALRSGTMAVMTGGTDGVTETLWLVVPSSDVSICHLENAPGASGGAVMWRICAGSAQGNDLRAV